MHGLPQGRRDGAGAGYKNVNIMPAGISGWEKAKKKLEV